MRLEPNCVNSPDWGGGGDERPPAPVLTSISPNPLPVGVTQILTLTGTGFGDVVKVSVLQIGMPPDRIYDAVTQSPTEVTVSSFTAVAPADYEVKVKNTNLGYWSNAIPLAAR